jgi:hypothetical protein
MKQKHLPCKMDDIWMMGKNMDDIWMMGKNMDDINPKKTHVAIILHGKFILIHALSFFSFFWLLIFIIKKIHIQLSY